MPLVSLNVVDAVVAVCLQPVDAEHGQLTLCSQAAVDDGGEETNLLPLGSWLHVSVALTPSMDGTALTASVTVHDVRLLTKVLADYDIAVDADNDKTGSTRYSIHSNESQCDNDEYGMSFVWVGGGSPIDVAELRVYRGGLSASEAKSMALAVHVLDPAGSRELET